MAEDPTNVAEICKIDASWAAVREARRAVSVAWVSTIINALVVGVAVGAPFLQQYVNAWEEEQQHFAIKQDMMRELKKVATELQAPPKLNKIGKPNDKADPTMVNLTLRLLHNIQEDQLEFVSEFNSSYQLDKNDFDLRNLLDRIKSVTDTGAKEARRYELSLSYIPYVINQDLWDAVEKPVDAEVQSIRELRLIYQLNTFPDGTTRPGEVILGTCIEKQHQTSCARPLYRGDKGSIRTD